jgi:phosphoribosylformylglycinamidine synthase
VAVEDTLGRRLAEDAAVYTATLYLFDGVAEQAAERIALELLANPIIHTVRVQSRQAWTASGPDLEVPRVPGHGRPPVQEIDLSGDDAALARLSRERLLALTLPEMHAIRDHFGGRAPTDVELECLAQTWSEHCKHKIFAADIAYEEAGETGGADHLAVLHLHPRRHLGRGRGRARARGDLLARLGLP